MILRHLIEKNLLNRFVTINLCIHFYMYYTFFLSTCHRFNDARLEVISLHFTFNTEIHACYFLSWCVSQLVRELDRLTFPRIGRGRRFVVKRAYSMDTLCIIRLVSCTYEQARPSFLIVIRISLPELSASVAFSISSCSFLNFLLMAFISSSSLSNSSCARLRDVFTLGSAIINRRTARFRETSSNDDVSSSAPKNV